MHKVLRAFLAKVLRRLAGVLDPPEPLPEPAPVEPVADVLSKVHPTELILAFFALLLREGSDSSDIWSTYHIVFRDNYEAFSSALDRNLEGDTITDLLGLFLIQVARNGLFAPERAVRMRELAEELGIHFAKDDPTELIRSFFALLLRERSDAKEIWRSFHVVFRDNYEAFCTALGRNMEGDELIDLLAVFLIQVANNGVLVPERTVRMFHPAEKLGVHVLPVHFFSPILHTAGLDESAWSERFDESGAWNLNIERQLSLLDELGRFAPELEAIPDEQDESGFCWNNPTYSQTDAAVYYSMIRHFQPASIVEIGAGYSTLIAASACLHNGHTVLEAFDPYPPAFLAPVIPGLVGLATQPVQKVPLARFQALSENGILFIDGTHVCKIASDVNYLIFSVLPRLNKGVLIHIHDIFLPWNYPRSWVLEQNIFWNEQYLLLAFLMFNDQFEIVLANHYLGREQAGSLLRAFPFLQDPQASAGWTKRTPSSIWLRKR